MGFPKIGGGAVAGAQAGAAYGPMGAALGGAVGYGVDTYSDRKNKSILGAREDDFNTYGSNLDTLYNARRSSLDQILKDENKRRTDALSAYDRYYNTGQAAADRDAARRAAYETAMQSAQAGTELGYKKQSQNIGLEAARRGQLGSSTEAEQIAGARANARDQILSAQQAAQSQWNQSLAREQSTYLGQRLALGQIPPETAARLGLSADVANAQAAMLGDKRALGAQADVAANQANASLWDQYGSMLQAAGKIGGLAALGAGSMGGAPATAGAAGTTGAGTVPGAAGAAGSAPQNTGAPGGSTSLTSANNGGGAGPLGTAGGAIGALGNVVTAYGTRGAAQERRQLAEQQLALSQRLGGLGVQSLQANDPLLQQEQAQRMAALDAYNTGTAAPDLQGMQAARAQALAQQQEQLSAFEGSAQPYDRSFLGGGGALSGWEDRAAAQYTPLEQARQAALAEQNAQAAEGRRLGRVGGVYDEAVQGVGQQQALRAARQRALEAYRQQLLAQAGYDYRDQGPSRYNRNLMGAGGMIGTAGQAISAFGG